ncbi:MULTISPECIES: hypothetical protein [unclassified Streptomyces]|nr:MULTISPECIES: hypothetical protein [unclassified Streptomyces]RAJ86716.1 putative secreted protein with PEP-CTERM sorting signal [Streptomyces sp. PsTaAH-137]
MTPRAIFLPMAHEAPYWLRITIAAVALGLVAARLWLFFRRRK